MAHYSPRIYADYSTAINDDLLTPAQGVGEQNRVGNKVRIQSIQVRGTLDGYDCTRETQVRMILYQYHPVSNGTSAPLISNLLCAGVTAQKNIYAPILPNQMHDFTIIIDKTFHLQSTVGMDTRKTFSFYLTKFNKFFHRDVKFQGNASVDGTNKVYLAFFSDETNAAPSAVAPKLEYWSRIRYLDD